MIRIENLACILAIASVTGAACAETAIPDSPPALQPLKYNNPGLEVDLGVGLWAIPMPMDYDKDGDNDLVVVSVGKPKNGIYFFENTQGNVKMPVFKPGVRLDKALQNIQGSFVGDEPRVLRIGEEYTNFRDIALGKPIKLPVDAEVHKTTGRIRANQWRYVDYDGDGAHDIVVGVEDWGDYGWDDAFDRNGTWTNGLLHGVIYLLRNTGSDASPAFAEPLKIEADGKPINGFGMPGPCFADFDRDDDLDLICGEFRDKLTYYQNIGSRTKPRYTAPQPLRSTVGEIAMDSCMITPVTIDWDRDGDADIIVGEEDGRVAFVENTGEVIDGTPIFAPPKYFRQAADEIKCGVLVNPVAFDWDGDGDQDLVCGDAAGRISFIENLGGAAAPKWAEPKHLESAGRVIRIQAGENGSIQGPAEAKWGYTTISVADWDHDGLPDIIANSIWGKVHWYRNTGSRTQPRLAASQPIEVEWDGATAKPEWVWWTPQGKELATQWRTTPVVSDVTGDALNDLVMLDRDGFLSLFERRKVADRLKLRPPKRIFRVKPGTDSVMEHNNKAVKFDLNNDGINDLAGLDSTGRIPYFTMNPMGKRENVMTKFAPRGDDPTYLAEAQYSTPALRATGGWAGRSGRRKLAVADWDGDGRLDVLINSTNVNLLRNIAAESGAFVLEDAGPLDTAQLAGHDTAPNVADFDRNGIPDLIVGAEDGFIYYMQNPRAAKAGN